MARTMQDDTTKPPVAFDHEATMIAVVELSRWWRVVCRGLPAGRSRRQRSERRGCCGSFENWQEEAERTGRPMERVIVAFEAGRDGFWLARLLRRQGIESYVIHPASIPVPRGVRAKTDRLDTDMLLRALSAWLRGEPDACRMAAIPSLEEEDLRRPSRERAALKTERTRLINRIRALLTLHGLVTTSPTPATHKKLDQLRTAEGEALPANTRAELGRLFERLALVKQQLKAIEIELTRTGPVEGEASLTTHALAMVGQLATLVGMGTNTAMVLVTEVFIREFPDRRALARFVGLTGTPDESGSRRRDRGLIKAGSSRVRHVMIQLAWRLLYHQPDCTLVHWYRGRVEQANGAGKKTFIVALARKLLIALWRFVRDGEVPDGMRLAAASPTP